MMQQIANWSQILTSIFSLCHSPIEMHAVSCVCNRTGFCACTSCKQISALLSNARNDLWIRNFQAYARKQAQCLLEIADHPESPVMASLQRWSLEVASLFMALYINNPKGMDTIQASRMDTGLPSQPHPDQFHDSLLVSCKSKQASSGALTA